MIQPPDKGFALWSQVKEKVFELKQTIVETVKADVAGFKDLDSYGDLCVLIEAPIGAVRSLSSDSSQAAAQDSRIELSPPTIQNRLIVRLVHEMEGYVTAEFEITGQVNERLVVALYDVEVEDSLIEVRSISEFHPIVRFERLSPRRYVVEMRGQGGKSKIPLNLKREE